MQAVVVGIPGGPEGLEVQAREIPRPGEYEVLIRVAAAGLNRTDVIQRGGRANLPEGATDILGLEVSGTVEQLGSGVCGFAVGDEVVALTDSGGYAQYVAVPEAQVAPAPQGLGLVEAAGIPEVAATVVLNILINGRYREGETVLIHGGTGGIGAFAIQLVKALGGTVYATAGSAEKCAQAMAWGADIAINYREENFDERVQHLGGADIILDTVAGSYLQRNLTALKSGGRMITIGKQGGASDTLDFSMLMKKKLTLIGSLLRDRTPAEKARIMEETTRIVWPLLADGKIKTTTDRVFPLSEVVAAHTYFDSGRHLGKVLLDCRS
ncbi:NAD(P)H-quinone oxidoreductase [Glutamicibacter sp.]|uniref:NAD(P)H-quinone oxidoreductase n=1 Tax=Glutamicibacter sp. TaxID=1931995 RepID=UPI003D6B5ABC